MKLRYKVLNGLLVFLASAIVVLAFALAHNTPCEPASAVDGDRQLMKAIDYQCYGSADVLNYLDRNRPSPKDDEVLVKIESASVNPADWHYMRGTPYLVRFLTGMGKPTDSRFGVDFSGTVQAVGAKVTNFQAGDEVFGAASGAFAEYVTVRANRSVVKKPANVSFPEAAGVPIAALTALQAVRDKGGLKAGQKVLINGASGGVGTYAVQIAKAMGAEVTGVCSGRNIEMVKSIGADHVINYKKEDYTQGGQRFDLIVDMVGNHGLLANRKVMKPNATLVLVGGKKGNWIAPLINLAKAPLLSLLLDQQFTSFVAKLNKQDLEHMAGLMAAGKVRTVIDRQYPLSEVAEAIRYSESGRARGKIIIAAGGS